MEAELNKAWILKTNVSDWLERLYTDGLTCSTINATPISKLKLINKDYMVDLFRASLLYNEQQNQLMCKVFSERESLRAQLNESQQRVIKLQDELLSSKTEQLQSLQSAVQTSVVETVKTELVAYSDAVKKNLPSAVAVPVDILRSVVKNVVEEEDRSRSVMMFGLPEKSDEELSSQVSHVFVEIGAKPRFEASRLGKRGEKARPVKVTLYNTAAVSTILSRARELNDSQRHRAVFICPDRSPAQRAQHRKLVSEAKENNEKEPTRRHFIRDGKVCSVEKVNSKLS